MSVYTCDPATSAIRMRVEVVDTASRPRLAVGRKHGALGYGFFAIVFRRQRSNLECAHLAPIGGHAILSITNPVAAPSHEASSGTGHPRVTIYQWALAML